MKTKYFIPIMVLSFLFITGNAQLRVDNSGNVIVKYGAFSPGNDATLVLGDANHYIKSVFGVGVRIGTYGAVDAIRIQQQTNKIGLFRDPYYNLDVNGYIRGWNLSPSDKSLKSEISTLSDNLNTINALEGVSFIYKMTNSTYKDSEVDGTRHFGFIAQDVRNVLPDLVYEDSDGLLSIDYISIIPILTEAIKEQQEQIDRLSNLLSDITSSLGNDLENLKLSNYPNPVEGETYINMTLPIGVSKAALVIYDSSGKLIKRIKISDRGNTTVTFNATRLSPGVYSYSLIADGKTIDENKMIKK